jgi:hypothetical protein
MTQGYPFTTTVADGRDGWIADLRQSRGEQLGRADSGRLGGRDSSDPNRPKPDARWLNLSYQLQIVGRFALD